MVISSAAMAARTEDTAEAASLEAEDERPSWKLGWLANDLGE